MHIHILGICGTFMGGVAVLAQAAGHRVTGCDAQVYPPMSTQLESQGITLIEGFDAAQLHLEPDLFVVGNVISRGNPLMEAILDRGLAYVSGPQWLADNILRHCRVLAVAGTHGKTTTSALVAWILEVAGAAPGFLIGGVPGNFAASARLPEGWNPRLQEHDARPWFVIEADEYDTAFFDKRSKFVHYRPQVAVLNNLEFDHADIFPDLSAIMVQFHHLVRTVPRAGCLVVNGRDDRLQQVLRMGCWSTVETFGSAEGWDTEQDAAAGILALRHRGEPAGVLEHWPLLGEHNRQNALAAVLAARCTGVPVPAALASLAGFKGVRRRMEIRGTVRGVTVYDDFAHHPTAIRTTLEGLRRTLGPGERILAVLEPRSNTMKMGVWADALANSLVQADLVFCHGAQAGWDVASALAPLGDRAVVEETLEGLVQAIVQAAKAGDHVLVMSNGGFGGIHDRLLKQLAGT